MENKKTVGIWIRVSTEDQARGESPEHHERRARLYAESKGWDVKVVYHLEALSGKSVMNYPQTKKMLQDVRAGNITGLIFSKLARLARNTKELLEFADIFEEEDADLISLQEAIDTSTPAGRLFYTMIAAMAQWEREETSDRIAASVPIRAKMGKNIGGQAAFGYKWNKNELEINEQEAPIRRLMFELFLKHKRKKAVARILNEHGYRTRAGCKFTGPTVARLIQDTMAKGERRTNYTKSAGKGSKRIPKQSSEWVLLSCPAIVSEEVWNECNRILTDQEKKSKRPGPKPKHLLAGLVYSTCGKKMYVMHHTKTPTYRCRTCKSRIAVEDLDEIFHEQLKSFLLTEVTISDYLNTVDVGLKEKEDLLSLIQNERSIIKKKMNVFIELRINGELSKEVFAEHQAPLEERLTQINNQLLEIEAEIDFLKMQMRSSEVVLQEAKDLYSQWSTLDFDAKRSIIELITEKIIVGTEDIHIKLSYVPSTGSSNINSKDAQTEEHSSFNQTMGSKSSLANPSPLNCGKRKHNQADLFCRGLSDAMKVPWQKNNLARSRATETQTHKTRFERWQNVGSVFFISHPENLEGKHVLLTDDVITTGSTLEACANTILAVPGTTVSIATIACAMK